MTGSGSVVGAGLYNPQEIISLQAVGNPSTGVAPRGFALLQWTWSDENGLDQTSTENPFVFSSSQNIQIHAEFYAIPPEEIDFSITSSPVKQEHFLTIRTKGSGILIKILSIEISPLHHNQISPLLVGA